MSIASHHRLDSEAERSHIMFMIVSPRLEVIYHLKSYGHILYISIRVIFLKIGRFFNERSIYEKCVIIPSICGGLHRTTTVKYNTVNLSIRTELGKIFPKSVLKDNLKSSSCSTSP